MPQPVAGVDPNPSVFHRLDSETLSKRMIESVNMVKELMQANRDLRENIEELNRKGDNFENDQFHLNMENRELRDRIEILESVIGSTNLNDDFEQLDWREFLEDE